MNKIKSTLLFLFLLFLVVSNFGYSQVKTTYTKKFKPPMVSVEVLFGYSQPIPNLYGEVSEFFTFRNYGVKYGFGSQINVKYSANKKGTVRPYLTLGYALFMGKDNSKAYLDSGLSQYPLPGSQLYGTLNGNSKITLHNFNSGLGFDYAFYTKTKWTPFLDFEVNMNVIFGNYKQDPSFGSVSFKPAVRFGFGFGGGVQLRITKAFGLAISSKYKLANIIIKKSEATSGGDYNKMYLLDKSKPDLNTYLNKDRQIDYFELMLGVVFCIGKR